MKMQLGVSGYCIQSQRTLYFAIFTNYSAEERVLQVLSPAKVRVNGRI